MHDSEILPAVAPAVQWAFKEWASVTAAIAAGRQSVLIRKGGIHEGPHGFQPEHHEFWLYPTRFHQAATELNNEGLQWIERGAREAAAEGQIGFRVLVQTLATCRLTSIQSLPRLEPLQICSRSTLEQRFHYREPGLWVLFVRAFIREAPLLEPEHASFGGCRTWVQLPAALPTTPLQPVLPVDRLQEIRQHFQQSCRETESCA